MKHFVKSERGASAILEAAFIYPVVILIIAAIIYAGLFILQNGVMFMRAQQVASIASKCVGFPHYEDLSPTLEGNDYKTVPGADEIRNAISKYTFLDAYRYWKMGENSLLGSSREQLEAEYVRLVTSGGFLTGTVDCKVTQQNNGVTQYVTVKVTGKPDYPKMFDYIGLGDALSYDITVRAVATDNAEFIRNADIVIDLTQFILNKLDSEGKLTTYIKKIGKFVNDITG